MKPNRSLLRILHSLIVFFLVVFLASCSGYKQLPYLKNAETVSPEILSSVAAIHEAKIMPNDIITITVNSNIPGAATDFNLPMVPTNLSSVIQTTATSSSTAGSLQNYLVDKDGKINFPILGELSIAGMTSKEAQNYIGSLIYPRYIAEKPVINVRFVNFGVSVLGEVARPGVYTTPNGQMTILDALAAAGDMTIYGRRNNVLLLRIQENGEIAMYRIDMQDKNLVLNKDLFYLQQNDKLYVETNKAKGNNSRFGTFESISLSALSIVISVIAIITR
ncbi:MAG: polysaccharide biosynthesis/export family protein [Dysgonomonas mossii]|uniref:polysaccharide biosynthesis/export family protein n=1 Tax=Dysgonomonas mossii TaxID=163665 RepID=UPI001D74D17E|nr:polysaccharide biosynthesis/export family protein [Dysgonomonas mossii]MBS5797748.1 polysaccharide biosynthesis/export family protein [Dysgonomonas mossii]MBS7112294.1 polysaccharide biosynthesis/export family protein [Dysgonomonas mossii]